MSNKCDTCKEQILEGTKVFCCDSCQISIHSLGEALKKSPGLCQTKEIRLEIEDYKKELQVV